MCDEIYSERPSGNNLLCNSSSHKFVNLDDPMDLNTYPSSVGLRRIELSENEHIEQDPSRANSKSAIKNSSLPLVEEVVCPHCQKRISDKSTSCPYCGISLNIPPSEGMIRLPDTIIFFAILLLVALNIAPDGNSDVIHSKAIDFLSNYGYILPRTISEASHYREVFWNLLELYEILNIFHYIILLSIIGFFLVNWFRMKGNRTRLSGKTWILFGLLLLVFPVAKLFLSWQLVFSIGMVGTIFASLLIIFSGIRELPNGLSVRLWSPANQIQELNLDFELFASFFHYWL